MKQVIYYGKIIGMAALFAFIGVSVGDSLSDWYKGLGTMVTPSEMIGWYVGWAIIPAIIGGFVGFLFAEK